MTARRTKTGRSTLVILALLFASSGALRLGSGVGTALANEAVEPDPTVAPAQCPQMPAALAEALSAREAEMSLREAALKDRTAALALSEAVIEQQLADLEAAEAALAATLAIADQAAERDLANLTTVYETMKPKDAAASRRCRHVGPDTRNSLSGQPATGRPERRCAHRVRVS
jgi:flagellar motility protein MotE (MotC chaperone)